MRFLILFLILAAQGWGAGVRKIEVSGSASELTNYQVRVDVAFIAGMQNDFSDIRFYDSGNQPIHFWIQERVSATSAVAWVKIPLIPTSGTTIYMRYGIASLPGGSSGENTFMFYDGFEETNYPKYPTVGELATAMVADQAWETSSPHTLTVVELNKDPGTGTEYKYWGYYGLQSTSNTAIGVAFSQDGLTWTKYAGNPILGDALTVNYRWASALTEDDYIYFLTHTIGPTGGVDLWKSPISDGLTLELVGRVAVFSARNPFLFRDPVSGFYYAYYLKGYSPGNALYYKAADTITGLIDATEMLMMTPNTIDPLMPGSMSLAAPAVIYAGTKYFLTAEDQATSWLNIAFIGDTPVGPWEYTGILNGGGAGNEGYACWFPQKIGSSWMAYMCHQDALTHVWDINVATLDIDTISTSTWKGLVTLDGPVARSTDFAKSGTTSAKVPYANINISGIAHHAPLAHNTYRWDYDVYIPAMPDTTKTYDSLALQGGGINISIVYGALIRNRGDGKTYALVGASEELQAGFAPILGWNSVSGALVSDNFAYYGLNGIESSAVPVRAANATHNSLTRIGNKNDSVAAVSYVDDIRLRKYASPEPVATVSSGGRNKSHLMLLGIGR